MDTVVIKIAAKINLTLDVTGVSSDGYHNLNTIMTSVGAYDTITVTKSGKLRVEMLGRVNDAKNAAYKTMVLASEKLGISGAEISIKKGIPFSGGMGGSSADISGVLIGLKELYGLSREDVAPIADCLGSDTVFMLDGGAALCEGRGNDVTRLPFIKYYLVIVKPFGGANTGAVFKKFDSDPTRTNYTDGYLRGVKDGTATKYIGNALTAAAVKVNGNIAAAIADLRRYSGCVSMTGSGSAVFAVFSDKSSADSAARELGTRYPYVYSTETVERGAELI